MKLSSLAPRVTLTPHHDSSYNVLTCYNVDATSVLDGVTVTGGYANEDYWPHYRAGGMMIIEGSSVVSNCQFILNYASDSGGGIYLNGSDMPGVIDNCRFAYNASQHGGGVGAYLSTATFLNCIFEHNSGTGIDNNSSSPEIADCIFNGNKGFLDNQGGAILERMPYMIGNQRMCAVWLIALLGSVLQLL